MSHPVTSRTLRWFLLLTLLVAAFFWKILFTGQYSMLLGWEGTNQAWSWYNYSARAVQQGILPAWDPYTESGRNFIGETQTGVFYPLKLLLYYAPFDRGGYLSERVYHQMYVVAHLLAAFFMFFCARELGIKSNFAAFVTAACFTLGGFLGKTGWVHLMDSAIWLPIIFYFLLRALRSPPLARRIAYSCVAGVCLGMAVLAGSIHIPLMDVMVIVSAAGLLAFRPEEPANAPASLRSRLFASAVVVFVVGVISFATGAAQLLPSMEFSPLARRWVLEWSGPFYQRVPYFVAGTYARMSPRAIFAFLFGAANAGGSEYSPYFGVMPLLLTVVGVWKNWANQWVRYLAVLGALAFVYGLGEYSLLNGLAYITVPFIDKSYEAGRFLYLTHFAMALLAGYGVQSLFANDAAADPVLARLKQIVGWTTLVVLVGVGVPALLGKPELDDWPYVSLFFLLTTWALFLYISGGHRGRVEQCLLIAVIVCDLYAFTWTSANRLQEQRQHSDKLEEMKSLRPVADFFKAQPGPFRVHFVSDFSPGSMGDVYSVQTTLGYGATMIDDYLSTLWSANGMCMFNVRYYLGSGKDPDGAGPVIYASDKWKVYENPSACPRAWMPSQIVVESAGKVRQRVQYESLDILHTAYLSEQPQSALSAQQPSPPVISYGEYLPDRFAVNVQAAAAGLLVLSEVWHPGWVATINGQPARVYKVDNILRGVVVAPGANHIEMRYRPASIRIGLILSVLALLGTLLTSAVVLRPK
jgi:membrane protein YfhO